MSDQSNTATAANTYSAAMQANIKASTPKKVEARVFRSNIASVSFIFPNGKRAAFVLGKYVTDLAYEITELDKEIAQGHPNFSSNVEEIVNVIPAMDELRAKFFEEFKAAQAQQLSPDNQLGTADHGKLNVLTTAHINEAAMGSDSGMPTIPNASGGGIKIALNKGAVPSA